MRRFQSECAERERTMRHREKLSMRQRNSVMLAVFAVLFSLLPHLLAGKGEQGRAAAGEDFFIVSSLDLKKKQLVLKHPTEVTELVLVSEKTVCVDEQGRPLDVKNLRAGDTVFVTLTPVAGGGRAALRIRRGPMTLEELRRRYLKSVTSE